MSNIKYWTNPSVRTLTEDTDPIEFIEKKAKEIVLNAMQNGWQGPPFDPFELAQFLKIQTIPNEDVNDARIIPTTTNRFIIEFNPNRSRGRIRFSVAHEISHTIFPDCAKTVRNRIHSGTIRKDDWQLELLCNIAAAEFLMPTGAGTQLENQPVQIDNFIKLQKQYEVSMEALALRIVKITSEPCAIFAAARISDNLRSASYRVDYNMNSPSTKLNIPRGLVIGGNSVLSECTAVGYTAIGAERWTPDLPEFDIECVGIPPYPGSFFPRILGITRAQITEHATIPKIRFLWGDATEPRTNGKRIITQIVNDKTPNWGGAFARNLKKRYPSVQDDFREWVHANKYNLSLGSVHVSTVSDDLTVISLIAQHGYGPSSKPRIRYQALFTCLSELAEIASREGASVHMPRIGSGQAGGNWEFVLELINETLLRQNIEVIIYTPPESEPIEYGQGALHFSMGIQRPLINNME
jgi:hypothetical protein